LIHLLTDTPPHHHLHPFPTRRSSDLTRACVGIKLNSQSRTERSCTARAEKARIIQTHNHHDTVAHYPFVHGAHRHLAQRVFLGGDRKSTRLNSSHVAISYAVFCLKKK